MRAWKERCSSAPGNKVNQTTPSTSSLNYAQAEYERSRQPGYAYIPGDLALGAQRVLEIGCLGAHGLISLREQHDRRAWWLGVELSSQWCDEARKLIARHGQAHPNGHLLVVQADGTQLPCRAAQFDLIICKLVLPYADNRGLLAEMARALSPSGKAILQIHVPRYYILLVLDGVRNLSKWSVYGIRCLLNYWIFCLIGRQVRFQKVTDMPITRARLMTLLQEVGLSLVAVQPHKTLPTFVLAKSDHGE
ncbi:MAG: class I SAM-dependent methyltransferase [Armatimonadetes bacterium]|nr:class I SAM-dependent methyltransferase [Armatimonadota bacterium]